MEIAETSRCPSSLGGQDESMLDSLNEILKKYEVSPMKIQVQNEATAMVTEEFLPEEMPSQDMQEPSPSPSPSNSQLTPMHLKTFEDVKERAEKKLDETKQTTLSFMASGDRFEKITVRKHVQEIISQEEAANTNTTTNTKVKPEGKFLRVKRKRKAEAVHWICQLSARHDYLVFAECNSAHPEQTDDEPPHSVYVKDFKDVLMSEPPGNEAPRPPISWLKKMRKFIAYFHIRRNRSPTYTFTLVAEEKSVEFTTTDEHVFKFWVDGLNILLGKSMVSVINEAEKEIEEFIGSRTRTAKNELGAFEF